MYHLLLYGNHETIPNISLFHKPYNFRKQASGAISTHIHGTIGKTPDGGEELSGILTAIGYLFKELIFLVSYVKNNAFPQPLSPKMKQKYLINDG